MSNEVNILIVTVTEVETSAVIQAFEQATGVTAKSYPIGDRTYSDLGTIDNVRFFLAISGMGSFGLGRSQETVTKGINALSPVAVIAVGIAFGIDEKQALGTILVSQQLRLCGLQRFGTQDDGQELITLRDDKAHASTQWIDRFKNAARSFTISKVIFGVMTTDDKLIDNINYRDRLRSLEPDAIGGEMEGAGLYVACHDKNVDWIVVKGICDWADGNKGQNKESRQLIAAQNAAAFMPYQVADYLIQVIIALVKWIIQK
jgi:nucleoside phosphorylase